MGLQIGWLLLGLRVFTRACAMRETEKIERIREDIETYRRTIAVKP